MKIYDQNNNLVDTNIMEKSEQDLTENRFEKKVKIILFSYRQF